MMEMDYKSNNWLTESGWKMELGKKTYQFCLPSLRSIRRKNGFETAFPSRSRRQHDDDI